MQFTQDMMLHSDSGYCMPFEERDKDVEMTLGYGKQKHPKTGEVFFHHGVDFNAPHYMLSAIATGKVTGMGNDSVHGIYQIIRYGDYEVNYGQLSNVFVNYGQAVKAGQVVSVREKSKSLEVIENSLAGRNHSQFPWIEWDNQTKSGKFLHRPERADIPETIKEQLIVELYSK